MKPSAEPYGGGDSKAHPPPSKDGNLTDSTEVLRAINLGAYLSMRAGDSDNDSDGGSHQEDVKSVFDQESGRHLEEVEENDGERGKGQDGWRQIVTCEKSWGFFPRFSLTLRSSFCLVLTIVV